MKDSSSAPLSTFLGILLLIAVGSMAYAYSNVASSKAEVEATLASTTAEFEIRLADATRQSEELAASLEAERARSADLEKDKSRAENKVDKLEELARLDPELLQKYSKIYFLNENYTPEDLDDIDEDYLFDANKPQQIHSDVRKYLTRMLDAAEDDALPLKVVSAYRSFDYQSSLKSGYSTIYGSGANAFSADQGYSEHQLGTTVDLALPGNSLVASFASTPAYAWLQENAYRYGFVLSYPAGNNYYVFEPWHWRYVGISLARRLHNDKKNFYDMDQRDIDKYLGKIFD